jgi:hypothetical protein
MSPLFNSLRFKTSTGIQITLHIYSFSANFAFELVQVKFQMGIRTLQPCLLFKIALLLPLRNANPFPPTQNLPFNLLSQIGFLRLPFGELNALSQSHNRKEVSMRSMPS